MAKLPNFTELARALPSTAQLCRAPSSSNKLRWGLRRFAELHRALLSSIELQPAPLCTADLQLSSVGFAEFCWAPQSFNVLIRALELHWAPPISTEPRLYPLSFDRLYYVPSSPEVHHSQCDHRGLSSSTEIYLLITLVIRCPGARRGFVIFSLSPYFIPNFYFSRTKNAKISRTYVARIF